MIRPTLLPVALLALLLLGGERPAAADQADHRLDVLFEQLKSGDVNQAPVLEHQIWQIWIASDDRVANRLMREGIGAMANDELQAARDLFDRLIDHSPDFAEAWNKRATVNYLMGDFAASVADIQKTLELEPRHFGALSGLGLIYDALEEPEAALRSFEAALAVNPHLSGTRERVEDLRRELEG
ncbi:MAG TPA: tetratricopeptide repeat protein, partial [Geminicoccaceae bacterium]